MKKKSLIETNPYLKDPELRKKLIKRSVRTSCAVEGITPKTDEVKKINIKKRKPKRNIKQLKK